MNYALPLAIGVAALALAWLIDAWQAKRAEARALEREWKLRHR